MTKALTYVELDVPDERTIIHLAFDIPAGAWVADVIDTNPAGYDHVWSPVGTLNFNAFEPSFGNAELFSAANGAVTTPDAAELNLGSGDFAIEIYFWKDIATGTERNLCGQRLGVGGANTTRAWNIDIDTAGHLRCLVFQGSTQIGVTGTTVFGVSSAYHHVSFVRSGSTLTLYVDGVSEGGTAAITGAINDSTGALAVMQDGDDTSGRWNGYVDEFSICTFARRTANFTPDPTFYPETTPALLPALRTLRFAVDAAYLPRNIDAIPSVKEVRTDPAIISLGADLGQRATVTISFRDHRHIFASEPFDSGTFWGKFRARYGLRLQHFPFRVINGTFGQSLAAMETRNYAIESADGPSAKGEFSIVAKDILKFADAGRAQAPVLSSGFLNANITNSATSITLSPTGIGSEYQATADYFVAIGGSEICKVTARVGDVLTIQRSWLNTDAVAHNAQDRVQLILTYEGENPADIIYDLLANYAAVPRQYMDLAAWQNEISTYLSTVYTAYIAEPTPVVDLISELIEQVGLAIWWDEISEQIKLQVLRPIASTADIFDADNYMAGSLEITEQPEKRLTRIYTYFAKINALKPQDQPDNYRSTVSTIDAESEAAYGTAAIKTIFSRWIPEGGRAVASTLNDVLLSRYRDPPRRIAFSLLRGAGPTPTVGVGYQIGGWPFQATDGTAVMVPAQITRLNPRADIFEVEVEEISSTAPATSGSPGVHEIIIDGSTFNVNLRDMHDSLYGTPISGNEVRCTINAGVIVGSAAATGPAAFDVGTWPGGVTVALTVNGRIQGHGGFGGAGSGTTVTNGATGQPGGVALFTRKAITLVSASGQIWGGGGGGGGGGSLGNVGGIQPLFGGYGGGGGAGTNPGESGPGGGGATVGQPGAAGTADAGGVNPTASGLGGGNGGGPGLTGATGGTPATGSHTSGGAGAAAGAAIDGISFVTTSGGAGDRRGGQIN